MFGVDVLAQFLQKMDLDIVVRGHQVVEDGYEFFGRRGLVTVFSAPNYCGEFDNAGAVMNVDENLLCSFQILKPQSQLVMDAAMAEKQNNFVANLAGMANIKIEQKPQPMIQKRFRRGML